MYAVYYKRDLIMQYLINNKADTNAVTKFGHSTLMEAVYVKNLAAVKILLENGGDPYYKNKEGMTVLHLCVKSTTIDNDILLELIKNKNLINITDNNGMSALHLAASGYTIVDIAGNKEKTDVKSHLEAIRILMEKGSNTLIKDKKGNTPYDTAKETGFAEALDVLDHSLHENRKIKFDLYIKIGGRKEIPLKIKKDFKDIIDKASNNFYDIYIVLFAGLIKIIDGEKPLFVCNVMTGPDMFGGGQVDWSLYSSKSSIYREYKAEIDSDNYRADVEIDEFNCTGSVLWDCGFDAWGTEITLFSLNEVIEKEALKFAESLFEIKTYFRKNITTC